MALSKIEVLGSSSSGCAYVLYFDNGDVYQLDAGVKNPKKDLVKKLYISHRHPDHDKYISDYLNIETILPQHGNSPCQFEIPHREFNNGYIINNDGSNIAYITDCGDWTKLNLNLSKCDYVFIESNWDELAISQKIIVPAKHAYYAFSKLGHMSNIACLNALIKWKVSKDCKIIFIHRSASHTNANTYKLFDILQNQWTIAKANDIIYCKSWKVL